MVKDIYAQKSFPDVKMPSCPTVKALKGQKALVTGASSGIGKAIALALGHAGASVVINYISGEEVVDEMIQDISVCEGKAIGFKADVSKEDEVRVMFEKMYDV